MLKNSLIPHYEKMSVNISEEVRWVHSAMSLLTKFVQLMVERIFLERLLSDGQLMEGQNVEIIKVKIYKILHWKTGI